MKKIDNFFNFLDEIDLNKEIIIRKIENDLFDKAMFALMGCFIGISHDNFSMMLNFKSNCELFLVSQEPGEAKDAISNLKQELDEARKEAEKYVDDIERIFAMLGFYSFI